MTSQALDWPQGAKALVIQAQHNCNLVKLIMDGVSDVESWLIAHQILPALVVRNLQRLLLRHERGETVVDATLIPLPDGSAFACHASGTWVALDPAEALHEIKYIGFRFAAGNRWLDHFSAKLELPGGVRRPLLPQEVAAVWKEVTGSIPDGFELGLLGEIEAIGYGVFDKMFDTRGRLGL